MIANYHTHTYRCGHAVGTDREYAENALKSGIKILGFSDHAPFTFSDGWRVPKKLEEDYFSSIKSLKKEFKDKLEIHVGVEMEYYPDIFADMFGHQKAFGAEYMILGQHNVSQNGDIEHFSTSPCDDKKMLDKYVGLVTEAISTQKFLYVAHPDVFNFTGDRNVYKKALTKIAEASIKYDVPLEINFLGLRCSRNYPCKTFFEVCGETGCKTIFGVDAHDPNDFFHDDTLLKAKNIVKEYGINLIEKIEI